MLLLGQLMMIAGLLNRWSRVAAFDSPTDRQTDWLTDRPTDRPTAKTCLSFQGEHFEIIQLELLEVALTSSLTRHGTHHPTKQRVYSMSLDFSGWLRAKSTRSSDQVSFFMIFHSLPLSQLWPAGRIWLRQDHTALVHCGPSPSGLGRDIRAGRQARHTWLRGAWKACGLHAAGDSTVRRVLHPGDHDVLRLDIRHGDQGDSGALAVSA